MPRICLFGVFGLLLLGGALPGHAQPQSDTTSADTTALGSQVESLLDQFGATEDMAEQVAERLAQLRDHPLNVNVASAADLSVLPGLSTVTAHRILRYRSSNGPFEQISALQTVDGIGRETVRRLRPFLVARPAEPSGFPSLERITSNLEMRLLQRYARDLDLGRGFQQDEFLGPPGRLTTRLRLEHEDHVEFGLTLDKDPGEPIRWAPATDTYGFDHVAGSLALHDLGPLETIVLGDFSAQFGQGLALWQGIRLGKGRDPISPVLSSGRGLLPYHSASEANYFRGLATTVSLPADLSLSAFVSRRHRDASLDSSLALAPGAPVPARTLSAGGQHRTPSELARKGTFEERVLGGALEYRSSHLHLGTTAYYARFGRPLRPGDAPYRRFRVSGRHTSALSLYGTAYLGDYTLFGEGVRTPGGIYGGLLGAAVNLGDRVQALLLGRHYPARLASFHGNAFGAGGAPQNQIGIYTGLRLRVAEDWTLQTYFDQFRAPWIAYNVPRSTAGWEARTVLEFTPRPWLSTYLQVRAQDEAEGTEHRGPGLRRLEGVHRTRRQSVRWHVEYAFSDALTLRTRLELARQATPATSATGFFLSQGVRWSPVPPLEIDARLAYFDTDGFAARIYAYEHDLLYSFAVPVFFDEGRRSYVMVQWEPLSSLTLEAKYGITSYAHRSTIGSGLNQIRGSSRRALRLQIRWHR